MELVYGERLRAKTGAGQIYILLVEEVTISVRRDEDVLAINEGARSAV